MGKVNSTRLFFVSLNLAAALSLSGCIINLPLLEPEPEDGPSIPGQTLPNATSSGTGTVTSQAAPLPPNFVTRPSQAVENDAQEISGEFTLSFPGPGNHLVVIPVVTDKLPSGGIRQQFVLEQQVDGNWEPTGFFLGYDAAASAVHFDVNAPAGAFATAQAGSGRYRIRYYLFSQAISVTKPGSKFKLYYYPAILASKSAPPADFVWNSSTGQASDPNVPDYVEDLDLALNQVYENIRQIRRSDGQPLFKAASEPIEVYITDTGEDSGNSPMNGPISISNTKIRSFQDMKNIAGHELVHMLEGQYYAASGTFTGRQNRAFLEAFAQYISAEANQLSPEQRKQFYGENATDYLSVALRTATPDNMYSVGHFLDWAGRNYGRETVADALARSSGDDFAGLSAAIAAKSGSAGLSSAYREYGKFMLTHPEDTANFALDQKGKMGAFALQNKFLKDRFLRDFRLYTRYTHSLPPLSMGYASIQANLGFDGLLVVHAQPAQGLVDSQSHLDPGSSSASYGSPLESGRSLFGGEDLTSPHFGANSSLEQMLINYSTTSPAAVDVQYYVLAEQDVTAVEDGKVSWDTVRMSGIPPALIRGFRVYANGSQVEGSDLVALSGGGAQSLSSPLIHPGDRIQVSVVDTQGNQWPPAPASSAPTGEPELIFSHNANDVSLFFPNSTETFEAEVRGLSNTALRWELIAGDFNNGQPLGSLDVNGNKALYRAPSTDTSACVRASSVARPDLVKQFCFTVSTSISTECVLPETPVTLVTGQKQAIQTLRAGDRILAWDPLAMRVTPANVDRVYRHAEKDYQVSRLTTDSGQDLTLTGNHPVSTPQGWRLAETLKPGDQIYLIDPYTGLRQLSHVQSVIAESRPAKVLYNLKTSLGNYLANDVLVHNKCLAGDALLETPDGLRRADQLAVGDRVWGQIGGERQPVRITARYRKQTVLTALPGKRLSSNLILTVNHRLQRGGIWIPAGETQFADQAISGPVYDFETESGNLLSEGFLLEAASAQHKLQTTLQASSSSSAAR